MYSTSEASASVNRMGGGLIDGSGTINPAALNSAGALQTPQSLIATNTSPRGLKRSRSPETYGDLPLSGEAGDDNDDQKPRKRGRPPKKSGGYDQSPSLPSAQQPSGVMPSSQQVRTPQLPNQSLPQHQQQQQTNAATPTQTSPPKSTPTKAVVKALPTVRDHTTDQLGPDGDEYIPREYDEAGERKVTPTGHPLDGREYKCRTFFVPNRHDKLFMLATECARVLGYRDSYLLFNKNRSLYKIIATQAEKDDLIHQEILPYSYRSRQIAIVTAKSMFRQFGSRVIVGGRRVRDDYWESKARKQGFTEEDLAGEKRPGAAKARDAAAAEAASAGAAAAGGPAHHADIIYSNGPAHLDAHLQPQTVQPGIGGPAGSGLAPLALPMILPPAEDTRLRDYGNVPRPRQEMSGQPYQDRTQATANADIMNQAQHTADFNKGLGQQRAVRGKYMDDFWSKPRESPTAVTSQQQPQPGGAGDQGPGAPASNQPLPSPQLATGGMYGESGPAVQQQHQPHQQQRGPPAQILSHQAAFSQQQHQQNPLAQSPIRGMPQSSVRADQMHGRSPSLNIGPATPGQGGNAYVYQQHHSQMWPPAQQQGQPAPQQQPQQSPLSQSHHPMPQQYGSHAPQPSPHQHSPHPPPHQLQQGGSSQISSAAGLQYQAMPGMGPVGYHPAAAGGRGLYQQQQQPGTSPQQFMHQTTAGAQPGMQGWAPPPQQSPQGPQGWSWGTSG
ncbi:MAG: hypothetical protein M1832_005900 [Thelocarpon impressellum]|nr:MAG: hypothetical protein M1832_005900 [Thelocarpon impressellum]